MLDDGTYDVFVVDAQALEVEGVEDAIGLDLTVLAGLHRGQVLTVRAVGTGRDPLDLLGVPGTLTVSDGEPSVELED